MKNMFCKTEIIWLEIRCLIWVLLEEARRESVRRPGQKRRTVGVVDLSLVLSVILMEAYESYVKGLQGNCS